MNPQERIAPQIIRKKTQDLAALTYSDITPIRDIAVWETADRVSVRHARRQKFQPCAVGRTWGGPWRTAWFRFRFRVPPQLKGRHVVARIVTGGEAVAFIGDMPVCGLNEHRMEVWLPKSAAAGRPVEILVEAGSNDAFGGLGKLPALATADLAIVNDDVLHLLYDLQFLNGTAEALPENDPQRAAITYAAGQAVEAFDFGAASSDELNRSAARIRPLLRPVFDKTTRTSSTDITLAGQSHLDVAWLWPLWETTRKCARTFSSMIAYTDRFPDFHFTQTQSYLYETTRATYPELYRAIRRAVHSRQWEVSTAMYVEPDCNMPSGESFIRQILFGKQYAREEFGLDVDVLLIPDTFGFSAALPQILRKSGIRYFVTQKLCWNETNEFPYTTFWWEGIDGSRVFSHLVRTYGGWNEPKELLDIERRHRQKDRSKSALYLYGIGDGGGGPTPKMIEFARRARNLDGLPACKTGFVSRFFHEAEAKSRDLPVWADELYLEGHRGTLTTQAKTKRLNRQCELALRNAEFLGSVTAAFGGKYDRKTLTESWKTVLLNQFHDILPGSSRGMVYELSTQQNAAVLETTAKLSADSAASVARRIDTRGDGQPLVVWNTLSWTRSGPVRIPSPGPGKSIVNASGQAVPTQRIGNELLFRADAVPPMGYEVYRIIPSRSRADAAPLKATDRSLENEFLRARINRNGELTSLIDKRTGREVLRGVGNELQLYDDRPHHWDAWEINYFTRDQRIRLPQAESVRLVERGPLRAAVEVRRRFSGSKLTQRIVLWAGEPRVDFETEVDWDESHKLLKVAFPVDVRSPEATYEIQFGSLRRPTHMNTTWDAAKFEVTAHKWADLSEAGFGVTLLNDCKYGHDIHENRMRLTLLRAPKEPDTTADIGHHTFSYSIMPHAGSHIDAGAVQKGHEFNVPLIATPAPKRKGALPPALSFFRVDPAAVILDTVKKAETGDDLILRLYEPHGGTRRVKLISSLPIRRAVECDLIEQKTIGPALRPKQNALALTFKPFEIKTLRLTIG